MAGQGFATPAARKARRVLLSELRSPAAANHSPPMLEVAMRFIRPRIVRIGKPPRGLRLRQICWIDRLAAAVWWILVALLLIAWSAR